VTGLAVRAASLADAELFVEIYAPMVREGITSFETEPPTPEQMRQRMSNGFPWLVASVDGRTVGYSYASAFRERAAYRWTVETSILVVPQSQGRGVGRSLYAALLAELTVAGYVTAVALISLPNPASVALHAALDFSRVGALRRVGHKHQQWIDVDVWTRELAIADRSVPPSEPAPWLLAES
jgi:phosphinothricin acetyltransferase